MTRPTLPTLSVTPGDVDALSPTELAVRLRQSENTLGTRLGIVFLEASRTQLVATMPVDGNLPSKKMPKLSLKS